jgi:hypothetical protein
VPPVSKYPKRREDELIKKGVPIKYMVIIDTYSKASVNLTISPPPS